MLELKPSMTNEELNKLGTERAKFDSFGNVRVLPDPDAKDYDPKTWNEVFETRWMTLDEIEELYGKDKSEDLQFIAENGNK